MAKHRAPDGDASDFDAATSALADVTGDYTVDLQHTRIGMRARHAMVTTVRGAFTAFEGTAHLDVAEPAASSVSLRIEAASIDTGTPDRDAHLRSGDFLDVERFPYLTFRSAEVQQVDEDVYRVTGDLGIKDVVRPVSIDFTLTGSARPLGTAAGRLRGCSRDPTRGLGPDVEHGPGHRRRARQRQDPDRVRRLGCQGRVTGRRLIARRRTPPA